MALAVDWACSTIRHLYLKITPLHTYIFTSLLQGVICMRIVCIYACAANGDSMFRLDKRASRVKSATGVCCPQEA